MVVVCIACGTSTASVDGSVDAMEDDVSSNLDGRATDAVEEWDLCSFEGGFHGDEAGVGQYYSCCAGVVCYGDCLVDGGTPHCDCGGIIGGCNQPSRCCGDFYADVLLLSCGTKCVFFH